MSQTRIHAPELPDHLEWFNTSTPLKLSGLRGKVVLLDFWSYCCINCLHIQPDLKYLENKYGDKLAIIGIHSPKYPHEAVGANLQKAINRYHISHPVANDPDLKLWSQYGIKAWPSVIFIDPEGYILGVLRGEGKRRQLDQLIEKHINHADDKGILNENPIPLSRKKESPGTLRFPGKLLATQQYLYISDSSRNRILEVNHHGRIIRQYGTGSAGLLDGDAENASFNDPQGLALGGDFLYVADRGNHAIRRINLQSAEVLTIAGNGQQGIYNRLHRAVPVSMQLNSPWDISYRSGILYIAMAGTHQIWKMDLTDNTLSVLCGSGREDLQNGPADEATFAQPSGLCSGEYGIFVADAESSAIRHIRLPDGYVSSLIGSGLFDFGDRDGKWSQAQLQHPMDTEFDARRQCIWISDTYNNKIKIIDMRSKVISTVNIAHKLDEPTGLSLQDNILWIANTNAHEIVRYNVSSGLAEVLEINEVSY